MEMSTKDLQLATASINFTKSLVDFVPASKAIAKLGEETFKWLARERIDEAMFMVCRELAIGLAQPNERGLILRGQVQAADLRIVHQLKKAPLRLRLIVSGSLRRLMLSCFYSGGFVPFPRIRFLPKASVPCCLIKVITPNL